MAERYLIGIDTAKTIAGLPVKTDIDLDIHMMALEYIEDRQAEIERGATLCGLAAMQHIADCWKVLADFHHQLACDGYPANRESYAVIYRRCAQELEAVITVKEQPK